MTNPFEVLPDYVKPGPQENPFKVIRKESGLTQAQVAREVGVTTQVIQQLEQGLYNSPPSGVLAWASLPGSDSRVIRLNYHGWVNQKRHSHEHLFRKVDLRGAKNPWAALKHQVAGKSNRGFCLALVYQPSLVREFEKFGRGLIGILGALRECGLEDDNIATIQSSYLV